jgi:hypothetical protein
MIRTIALGKTNIIAILNCIITSVPSTHRFLVAMAEDLDDGKQSKYVLDALRYTDFLPGAHYSVNIQKKRFYKLLVKKGLVYMYDNHYDLDPDSPILRNDGDEDDDDDDGVQTECTNSTNAEGFSSVGTTALPLPLGQI